MAELSAYELERLANIRRNEEKLAFLGLGQGSTSLVPKPAAERKPKRPPPPAREASRKSARVAALPAPVLYVESELSGRVRLGGADSTLAYKESASAEPESALPVSDEPVEEDDAPASEDALYPSERAAYALLREQKNAIARELEIPAYHVAQNRALMSMARRLPESPVELYACWGWGEAKVGAYGERLLAVLNPLLLGLRAAKAERKAAKEAEEMGKAEEQASAAAAERAERAQARADAALFGDDYDSEEVLSAAADDDDDAASEASVAVGAKEAAEAAARAEAAVALVLPLSPEDLHSYERDAFEALLAWKRARAKELGFSDPCVICHNRTLCELVRLLPASLPALQRVWGIGAKRAMQHGQLMIDALEPFRQALEARQRPVPPKQPKAKAKTQVQTQEAVLEEVTSVTSVRTAQRPRRGSAASAESPNADSAGTDVGGWSGGSASSGGSSSGKKAATRKTTTWREEAGADLASEHWRVHRVPLGLPACGWNGRRARCAHVHGCEACARFMADGRHFEYAVQSQKLLDMLSSPGGYGSMSAAHEAGWRWNASPNHGSSSHAHQWWPPQTAIDELLPLDVKLPLGTNKALALLDELF